MLTKKISNWMIAAAIILGVAALTPNDVAAQGGIFICATCDSVSGSCGVRLGEPINDVCISGTWDDRGWCVSHGRLWCDPRIAFDDVGADGALLRERTFASSAWQELETRDSQTGHVRDCRSRIVARSYGSDEAEDMRRRTESIVI
jgi:hypothetical protein